MAEIVFASLILMLTLVTVGMGLVTWVRLWREMKKIWVDRRMLLEIARTVPEGKILYLVVAAGVLFLFVLPAVILVCLREIFVVYITPLIETVQ